LVHPQDGRAVASTDEVRNAAPKAKVLNRERVSFEVAEGNYHPAAAFDFQRQIAFVKFVGSAARACRVGRVLGSWAGVCGSGRWRGGGRERPVAKPHSTVVKIGL